MNGPRRPLVRLVLPARLLALLGALPLLTAGGVALLTVAAASGAAGAGPLCAAGGAEPSGSGEPIAGGEFRAADGRTVVLEPRHLRNAQRMLAGAAAAGADERATLILFMAAFQESGFRNYSNAAAYPESLGLGGDGDAHDEDSLGVLQQRPSMGWGEVAELMDVDYAVRAFLGGPDGPNAGSPPGLFDLEGWRGMGLGQAAQAVQFSAHPERYEHWREAAGRLLAGLGGPALCRVPTGEAAYPLPAPAPVTDGVGPRPCELPRADGGCAHSTWHPALDFDAACGTPVFAGRPGVVTAAADAVLFVQGDDGALVQYLHMPVAASPVSIGDRVRAGQRIGEVGNEGASTGCHLDLRVDTAAATDPAVRALPRIGAGEPGVPPGHWADPVAYFALFGVDLLAGGAAG
ncbi:MAG: M23 family metallopeptidase [Pseudoclavibacter sp.]|nr:M23 family metallopeptidase [Pseudoclavibacter sp.]